MGKGDVKSRRGKIWRGSYGNKRRKEQQMLPLQRSLPIKSKAKDHK